MPSAIRRVCLELKKEDKINGPINEFKIEIKFEKIRKNINDLYCACFLGVVCFCV